MSTSTVVATANVMWKLPASAARLALAGVLEHRPDVVGLQEWGLSRAGLLRETGDVHLEPGPLRRRAAAGTDYLWVAPIEGGCPIGLRTERFELVGARQRVLSLVGLSDRQPGRRPEPLRPRILSIVGLRDRWSGEMVSVLDYHLTPGVQARGAYRTDRPRLVARHQHEVRRLAGTVESLLARGDLVVALGDSNFDGLRLPGLTSAWQGREAAPGTLGARRKVDDVHGPGPASGVRVLANASDHRAVLVTRPAGRSDSCPSDG